MASAEAELQALTVGGDYVAERDEWLEPDLAYRPTTMFVVPLTSTRRTFPSHVEVEPDLGNQLSVRSYALVEQLRAVSVRQCGETSGRVG